MPDDAIGCWVVRTARTTHLFDFDAPAYARVPDPGRKPMPHDRVWLALRGVREVPAVGRQFTVYVDAVDDAGHVLEQLWRTSAPVVSLEQVERGRLVVPPVGP
jgi:hypothetical protein